MKSVYSPTIIYFLLVAINLSLVFSADIPTLVLDTLGLPLKSGDSYQIIPVLRNQRGGIVIGQTDDSDCAYLVTQHDLDVGLPVKFLSTNILGSIFTGSPIDIEFKFKPNCIESSKWLVFVDSKLDPLPIYYVGIGGPKNYPSHTQIFNGTFSIQRSEEIPVVYTLNYCIMDHCSYIGANSVLIGNETDRRMIVRHPILVLFERVMLIL